MQTCLEQGQKVWGTECGGENAVWVTLWNVQFAGTDIQGRLWLGEPAIEFT